jgi:Ca2+-binding RTX toxin-like protein
MVLKANAYTTYFTSSQEMGTALITGFAEATHTATSATVSYYLGPLNISGTDLTYDNAGRLTGGLVHRVEAFYGGERALVISGFSMNVGLPAGTTSALLEANPVWDYDASGILEGDENGLGVRFRSEGGDDTLRGSRFNDELFGYDGKDSLIGNVGSDTLDGGDKKDTLEGGDDNDYLFGGRGNDKIRGGGGDDMIHSRNGAIRSQKIDLANGTHTGSSDIGTDKLQSIESFYGGWGDDTILGSAGANTLIGSSGNDVINGKGGDDEIWTGFDRDTVTGGTGADFFVFDTFGFNTSSLVRDFKPGKDRIGIYIEPIGSAMPDGPLAGTSFRKSSKAKDADDFVLYSRTNGKLWFDPDGSGPREKYIVATFSNKPVLSASDITTVDHSDDWWLI